MIGNATRSPGVINLDLADRALGKLMKLRELDLSHLGMSWPLPSSLSKLGNLEFLNLEKNAFRGNLSSLSSLRRLQYLDISYSQFEGQVPEAFTTFDHLTWLYARNTNLRGLPSHFPWRRLRVMDISHSNLSGILPSFDRLTSLTHLRLEDNKITGFRGAMPKR
mmetsp:Transcript_51246/g.128706  ORF Transcript_51246/g.128706 Transcript_51246/m.128706 type:complete len:164 (-) Transcript_51246:80-571(-)